MSDKPLPEGNGRKSEDQPSSNINSPTESEANVDVDSDNDRHGRKRRLNRNEAGPYRHRPPTPYPQSVPGTKVLRGHQSLEVTRLQPDAQIASKNASSKAKSVSMDAMAGQAPLGSKGQPQRPSTNNNNNVGGGPDPHKKESWLFKKGKVFRSNKVGPGRLDEVITISPVMCPSQDCPRCQNPSCGRQMGESCLPVDATKSNDSMENICRICHDSPSAEKLIAPCLCKGSMGKVHRTCLERWLGESGKNVCEICGQEYNTVRIPKYKGARSVVAWIKNPLSRTDTRNFFFDVACFFILTPLACLSAWLCVLGAQHYSLEQHKVGRRRDFNETLEARANRDASNSTWTSVGLLSLTGTLVAAYYIWIFVAIRYHLQVWREWQQRNYIVTIVPLANGNFSRSPPPPASIEDPTTEQEENDSDSSDPPARPELQRVGGYESWEPRRPQNPEDRNNNANGNNPTTGNNCRISSQDPSSRRRRMVEENVRQLLQQRSSTSTIATRPVSKTLLFYQKVFGTNSDECLTEDEMIQLALLQSAAETNLSSPTTVEDQAGPSKVTSVVNNIVSVIHLGKDGIVQNTSSKDLKSSEVIPMVQEMDNDYDNNPIGISLEAREINDKLHKNNNALAVIEEEVPSSSDSNPEDTVINFDSDDIGRGGNSCTRDYSTTISIKGKDDQEYDLCQDFRYHCSKITNSTSSMEACGTSSPGSSLEEIHEASASSRSTRNKDKRSIL